MHLVTKDNNKDTSCQLLKCHQTSIRRKFYYNKAKVHMYVIYVATMTLTTHCMCR